MGQAREHPVRTLLLLALLLVTGLAAAFYAAVYIDPNASEPDTPLVPGETPGATPNATQQPGHRPAAPVLPGTDAKVRGVVRLYRTKAAAPGLTLTLKAADGSALTATTEDDGAFRFEKVTPGPGWQLNGSREPFAPIAMPLEILPSEDKDLGTLWLEVPV